MIVFDIDQVVTIDIDDTLVMWSDNFNQPHEGASEFTDPYDNSVNYLVPHIKHINLLKKYKGRGYIVIVWSAGGVKWAESVIKSLKIESYVDIVLTKPSKYVDDLPANEWMGTRVYIK